MVASYVFIAGILLYILLLQKLDLVWMRPIKAATIWAIGYYGLLFLTIGLEYAAKGIPVIPNLLTPPLIATTLAQFAVAVVIFHKAEESGDEYMSYIFWGGLGLALLFFVVPPVVQQLFAAVVF